MTISSVFGEGKIRFALVLISLFSVPPLLLLSYRGWASKTRASLPHWRNGFGLTAVTLASLSWLWLGLQTASGTWGVGVFTIEFFALAMWIAVVALVLSTAWKGTPRLEVIAACLLLAVGYHFWGYI